MIDSLGMPDAARALPEQVRAALDAGCDDLMVCAESECCPLPFVGLVSVSERRS